MRHFAGFQRLVAALPLCAVALGACGGGGGGDGGPPPETLYVRRSGDDGNDGATPDTAYRSIARAVQDAVPGQTIIVGPGTYTVPRSFPFNAIDIEDINGEELILVADRQGSMSNDQPGEVIVDARSGFGIRVSRSSNVTIQGFQFVRARGGQENAAIQVRSNSSGITIRDCVFELNRDAIRVEGSAGVTIFNNLFFDNNRAVRLNGADDVAILSNTIANNDARGISFGGSAGLSVRNNILQDNSNRNIEADDTGSASTYEGDFNLIFSTRRNTEPADTVSPSTLIGENVVGENALFVDADRGDFHLTESSPAIDAGGSIDGLLLQSLFGLSTTPDGAADRPPIDLGYHFPEALEN
jgi:parallel beta-helix repeat protein